MPDDDRKHALVTFKVYEDGQILMTFSENALAKDPLPDVQSDITGTPITKMFAELLVAVFVGASIGGLTSEQVTA